jgi:hypothetical protein
VRALLERYPALTLSLLGLVGAAAVKFVPGLAGYDPGDVVDYIALAISLATGVEIHRRVKPVDAEDRAL